MTTGFEDWARYRDGLVDSRLHTPSTDETRELELGFKAGVSFDSPISPAYITTESAYGLMNITPRPAYRVRESFLGRIRRRVNRIAEWYWRYQ
jgi:hypothetical protein